MCNEGWPCAPRLWAQSANEVLPVRCEELLCKVNCMNCVLSFGSPSLLHPSVDMQPSKSWGLGSFVIDFSGHPGELLQLCAVVCCNSSLLGGDRRTSIAWGFVPLVYKWSLCLFWSTYKFFTVPGYEKTHLVFLWWSPHGQCLIWNRLFYIFIFTNSLWFLRVAVMFHGNLSTSKIRSQLFLVVCSSGEVAFFQRGAFKRCLTTQTSQTQER